MKAKGFVHKYGDNVEYPVELGKDERIDPLDGCLYRWDVFDDIGCGNRVAMIDGCGGVVVKIDIIPGDIVSTDVEIVDDIFFHGMFSESWRT